ncbi:MAG: hypothetical protein HY319_20450 [Armatimonadetes bacterium]|nr:hypothetical protein [Armatimonadota bacterium]
MLVMSASKAAMAAKLRERGHPAEAAVVESCPGDTVGAALYGIQQERQGLLRHKHRCLMGGLAGIGLLTADCAINTASVGGLHVLGRLALMLGSVGLFVKGGVTGDNVDATWRTQSMLTYWARELRHETQPETLGPQADLVRKLADHPGSETATRQELFGLIDSVADWLENQKDEKYQRVLSQVEEDRKLLAATSAPDAPGIRAELAQRAQRSERLSMACLIGAGVSTLGAMFMPAVLPAAAPLGIAGLGGLLGAGVLVQDRRNEHWRAQDALDRWELQLADLKDMTYLTGRSEPGMTVEKQERFIDVGGVRVPVRR